MNKVIASVLVHMLVLNVRPPRLSKYPNRGSFAITEYLFV